MNPNVAAQIAGTSEGRSSFAPSDIIFRLAALAAISVELFWLPIYYWSTYEPSGDERDGGVLLFALIYCPVSWILAPVVFASAWRRGIRLQFPFAFRTLCTLLLSVILSPLFAFAYQVIKRNHFS